jgi:dihydrofolate synthase / folylpolyglutamate synthase
MNNLDYLLSLKNFGSKLGLERMLQLCKALGNPQNTFKSIHVAGTNGKGSTSAFIYSILQEAGYKVGMNTSPHLVTFNERIKVNGNDISDSEINELIEEIRIVLEENNIETTFFEFTTAMAFLYFARKKVDYAVIEVGLGGRLDGTNVITPEIAVITNIGLDHVNVLGNTIEEISREKAGIIKERVPVISGEKNDVIEKICKERNCEYSIAETTNLKLGLEGEHQKKNAGIAVNVAKMLDISPKAIESGLTKTKWPGRLQWVRKDFLVDGAHNVEGMKYFVDYIKNIEGKKALLVSFSQGKNYKKMFSMVENLFDKIIITKGNFKPINPEDISKEHLIIENSQEALIELEKFDGLKVCAGSLYLIGDILKFLKA